MADLRNSVSYQDAGGHDTGFKFRLVQPNLTSMLFLVIIVAAAPYAYATVFQETVIPNKIEDLLLSFGYPRPR